MTDIHIMLKSILRNEQPYQPIMYIITTMIWHKTTHS